MYAGDGVISMEARRNLARRLDALSNGFPSTGIIRLEAVPGPCRNTHGIIGPTELFPGCALPGRVRLSRLPLGMSDRYACPCVQPPRALCLETPILQSGTAC